VRARDWNDGIIATQISILLFSHDRKGRDSHNEPDLLRRAPGRTLKYLGSKVRGKRHNLARNKAVMSLVRGQVKRRSVEKCSQIEGSECI